MVILSTGYSQGVAEYPRALVSMDDYESVHAEAKKIRLGRLISLDQLNVMALESNTVILDTRSRTNYNAKHIKGAINLPFTEFTTANLRALIPNTNTRIIIYCNNNFIGDQVFFASKVAPPKKKDIVKVKGLTPSLSTSIFGSDPVMLALNIPTYINLHGYGYSHVFELDELVDLSDSRLQLESQYYPQKQQVGVR